MEFNCKNYVTSGACQVIDKNNCMEIVFDGKGAVSFDEFSTLRDTVSVKLSYTVRGDARLGIYGIRVSGEELYRSDALIGTELSYSYDPINLAVYRDMHAFRACIAADSECTVTVSSFVITDEVTETVNSKGVRMSSELHDAPENMLFVGNSLVFGMEFNYGMCATDKDRDYFHYVSEYVKTKNPDCRFKKLYGSCIEACETLDAFENVYYNEANKYTGNPVCESFTPDTDLIILQLGDNVNTPEKNAVFEKSRHLLIERIRKACPNARLIWVHGWYNREPTYSYIVELCERWGIERIEIGDLRCRETEAHDQATFVNSCGVDTPIKDTWRTHPGDRGMKAIAERIVSHLNLK